MKQYDAKFLRENGLVLKNGRPVCDFCGGNCGQCGMTGIIGNVPASMQTMVNSLYGRKPTIAERIKKFFARERAGDEL